MLVGIYWANYHSLFRWLANVDRLLLLVNTLFLMCLVLIPFATSLLTLYVASDQQHVAALVYNGILLLTALSFNLIWWYALSQQQLLRDHLNKRIIRGITRTYLLGPFFSLITMLISLVSVKASLVFLILGILFFALPLDRLHTRPRTHDVRTPAQLPHGDNH